MASIGEWLEKQNSKMPELSATETYSKIKSFGLKTVEWMTLSYDEVLREEVKSFIDKKKPCLFIWDPKTPDGKKDYLFDVKSFDEIVRWESNTDIIKENYSFLITTKICPLNNGFVGSIFSDGCGNIFCETLHVPNNCNHRLLSQFKREGIQKYLNQFSVENYEIASLKCNNQCFILKPEIEDLIKLFGNKKGYFEFVKGIHCGEKGIFVTGFSNEPVFNFPHEVNHLIQLDTRARLNKLHLNY